MSQQPDPERTDQPGIDLGKGRPGGAPPPPPPPGGYPPPPQSWQQPAQQSWQQPPQQPPQPSWQQPWQQGQVGQPGPHGSRLAAGDERFWAGAAHWSALIAMAVAMAFLGPLLVLLLKGGDSPFVRRQAVESLNFQLTILIAGAVSAVLLFVVVGLLLLPIVGLAWLVFTIIGAVKASSGEEYRYPFSLRMVR